MAFKEVMTHPVLVRVCRIAIGVLFGLAGLAKLGDLGSFADQVHNFRIVPVPVEHLVALTLPWIEVVAALALILGIRARAAAVLVTALMAVFTLAVIAALARGLDFECGCFGTADATRVGAVKVVQNVGMLMLAWIGTARGR